MVKKKELNFIIWDKECRCLAYNFVSGNIKLPNMKGLPVIEELINFPLFIISITHEFLHKWFHENVSINASLKWDKIDKNYHTNSCPLSGLEF